MTKIELAVAEEAVVEIELQEFELSLSELDLVGGGTIASILG